MCIEPYVSDLERKIAQHGEELARSNRELETVASIVAHDLRSALVTIAGYCQLLQEEYGPRLDGEALEYLRQMISASTRIDSMVENLLEYSRAGRNGDAFHPVDVRAVLDRAMGNLKDSIRKHDARIDLDDMPTIEGDESRLGQLFENLLDNAIKFHRDEPPRVRITALREQGAWRFAVSDNGIGIAQEDFERIFQIFQRLQGHEFPGAGMGLAISKKIVERHGGRLWLESVVGQGSTFFFTLPAL